MKQSAILILLHRMMYSLFCNRFHCNAGYTVDFARIWMYTTQTVQYIMHSKFQYGVQT